MDSSYAFAPINGRDDILKEISRFESDLSGKIGQDVILIAYTKKGSDADSPFASI